MNKQTNKCMKEWMDACMHVCTYQGQHVGQHGVHVRGALAVEHGALGSGDGLHDEAVDDAQEEGAEVQRALDVQHILRHAPADYLVM